MANRAELFHIGQEIEHASFHLNGSEARISQEVYETRQQLLSAMRILPQPGPYGSSDLEYITTEDEKERELIVDAITSASPELGRAIWGYKTKVLNEISRTAGSHSALERIYSGPDKERESEEGFKWADLALRRVGNARSVRNRLNYVRDHIRSEVERNLSNGNTSDSMNILSIASGSSRAVLSSIAEFDSDVQRQVMVRLSDLSTRALRDGVKLAENVGFEGDLETRQANFLNFNNYIHTDGISKTDGWDVIEIVGLLDYPDDDTVKEILKHSYQNLKQDGSVIISNVAPNDEKDFLKVIGWPDMEFRSGDHLFSMAEESGFSDLTLITEPTEYCNLVVARK